MSKSNQPICKAYQRNERTTIGIFEKLPFAVGQKHKSKQRSRLDKNTPLLLGKRQLVNAAEFPKIIKAVYQFQ